MTTLFNFNCAVATPDPCPIYDGRYCYAAINYPENWQGTQTQCALSNAYGNGEMVGDDFGASATVAQLLFSAGAATFWTAYKEHIYDQWFWANGNNTGMSACASEYILLNIT